MEVIKDKYNKVVLVAILLMLVLLAFMAEGCTTSRYSCKVTFQNGTVDYYELTYKPKKDAKAIEYDGETIIGVQSIEILK